MRLLTFLFVNGVDLHGMKCSLMLIGLLILILFDNVDFRCMKCSILLIFIAISMLNYIDPHRMKCSIILMGMGKTMVELCSAEMVDRVCRYLQSKHNDYHYFCDDHGIRIFKKKM